MADYLRDPAAIYARSFALIRGRGARWTASRRRCTAWCCGWSMPAACPISPPSWPGTAIRCGAGRDALAGGATVLVDAAHGALGRHERPPAGRQRGPADAPTTSARRAWPPQLRDDALGRRGRALAAASRRCRGRHRQCAHGPVPSARAAARAWPERPAAILAFPVGFVGAAESKEALVAAGLGCALGHAARPARRQRHGRGRGQRAARRRRSDHALADHRRHRRRMALDGLGQRARAALADAEVLVGGAGIWRWCRRMTGRGSPGARRSADTLADLDWRCARDAWRSSPPAIRYGSGSAGCCCAMFPRRAAHPAARLGLPGGLRPAGLGARGGPTASAPTAARSTALRRHLQPGRRLLVLTADGVAPRQDRRAAGRQRLRGRAAIWVLEDLAGPARADRPRRPPPTMAIGALRRPERPGGRARRHCRSHRCCPSCPACRTRPSSMTARSPRREVRAVTLAALAPLDGELLWDVGAGCRERRHRVAAGGPAACAPSPSSATPTRAARIGRNAARLGVPELEVRARRGARGR